MRDASGDAGVEDAADDAAGNSAVERMRRHAERTFRPEVIGSLGGFGGLFRLDTGAYREPVLVAGAGGVGLKLEIAFAMDRHDTIGIDAVAMCVNGVAAQGAEPLFFLDHLACDRIDPETVEAIIEGIADGCAAAGCALIGGATAEMPGMVAENVYDIAGFAVGLVERDAIIDGASIRSGDVLLGAPSSGLHSNGFTLVREILADRERFDLGAPLPELDDARPLGEVLLTPTTIYVHLVRRLTAGVPVRGLAHVTGGGLLGAVRRVLPEGLGARLRLGAWPVPPIFRLLQREGELSLDESAGALNMGIGMVVVVSPEAAGTAMEAAGESGVTLYDVGRVVSRASGVSLDADTPFGLAGRRP